MYFPCCSKGRFTKRLARKQCRPIDHRDSYPRKVTPCSCLIFHIYNYPVASPRIPPIGRQQMPTTAALLIMYFAHAHCRRPTRCYSSDRIKWYNFCDLRRVVWPGKGSCRAFLFFLHQRGETTSSISSWGGMEVGGMQLFTSAQQREGEAMEGHMREDCFHSWRAQISLGSSSNWNKMPILLNILSTS